MTPSLAHQRCFNHLAREAVARCPSCSKYFCRECITEHDERIICAACLRKLAKVPLLKRRGFAIVARVAHCLLGIAAAWFLFYLIGEALLSMPAAFHDATLWNHGDKSE